MPKGAAGFFVVWGEHDLATIVRVPTKAPYRQIEDKTMQERQGLTDKEKHDRRERTSDAARTATDIERTARDAKTARLREQRLKAALPAAPASKAKTTWKGKKT
ncbi:hypothetical protein [Mesorhizobium escarrei]|uniref:hypothetical protein n=1 Tax=Mesorhizobium escarrei TaxID=666018 RepID=UPI0020A77A95|nr:hypothetical protein [Mesorhizobium escarrei]